MLEYITFCLAKIAREVVSTLSSLIDNKGNSDSFNEDISSYDKEEWVVVPLGVNEAELNSL